MRDTRMPDLRARRQERIDKSLHAVPASGRFDVRLLDGTLDDVARDARTHRAISGGDFAAA
jgi:hypothetical protein